MKGLDSQYFFVISYFTEGHYNYSNEKKNIIIIIPNDYCINNVLNISINSTRYEHVIESICDYN